MAVTAETNVDEFKGKDHGFVAGWLKTKGLHELCSVLLLVIVHTKSAPASILYVKGIKFLEKFHCVEGNYYLTYELKFYIFL